MPPVKRTPDEIRASIEQSRQELGTSLVRLRDEVTELTDWRGQVRRNEKNLQIGAAVAGFVIAGGIGGLGSALFGVANGGGPALSSVLGHSRTTVRVVPCVLALLGPAPSDYRRSSALRRRRVGPGRCGCRSRVRSRTRTPGRCRRSRAHAQPAPRPDPAPVCAERPSRRRRRPSSSRPASPGARTPSLLVRTRSTAPISDSRERIGLILRAVPSQAWAPPMRPPLRRYSSVSSANRNLSWPRACCARSAAAVGVTAAADRGCCRHQHQALGPARRLGVDHVHALGCLAELLPRLLRRVDGPGKPAGEMDRDDLVAGGDQRLVDREEVSDRGLRRGRQIWRRGERRVVRVVVRDRALTFGAAAPMDVEADLVEADALDDLGRQVMAAVGDDRNGRHGAR